jgi:outer membrane protein OmpA-like peptidoglycan-associated protein
MERIVLLLEQHPDLNIVLQGHTDSIGTKEYNQRLSEKRAIQVRNVMITRLGAPPDRILTAGFGEGYPVEENTSGHGRSKNRRDVTVGFETKEAVGF